MPHSLSIRVDHVDKHSEDKDFNLAAKDPDTEGEYGAAF